MAANNSYTEISSATESLSLPAWRALKVIGNAAVIVWLHGQNGVICRPGIEVAWQFGDRFALD